MAQHRSNYLIHQLLSNQLSRVELDEFLAGLHNPDDLRTYSDRLKTYFNELLQLHQYPPEPDENGETRRSETKPPT